jgi:hypothetical protein
LVDMTRFDQTVPCEMRDAKAERADSDALERLESSAQPTESVATTEDAARENGAAAVPETAARGPVQFAPPNLPGGSKSP